LEDKGKELYLREKELEDRIKEYEKAMEELEVPSRSFINHHSSIC
jgi:hypothetical protein